MRIFWICVCMILASCSSRETAPTPVAPIQANQGVGSVVNSVRSSQGRAPLSVSPVLNAVAQAHANEMAARGVLSHTGANGSTAGSRTRGAGYSWCLVAENIAQGQTDLAEAMESWINSPPHRSNLLNPDLREVGLGQSGSFWVMLFATPGC